MTAVSTTFYENPADLFVAGFIGPPPTNMLPGRLVRDRGVFVEPKNAGAGLLRVPLPAKTAGRL
jgi:multiple sugar transport system ATP-binding protein